MKSGKLRGAVVAACIACAGGAASGAESLEAARSDSVKQQDGATGRTERSVTLEATGGDTTRVMVITHEGENSGRHRPDRVFDTVKARCGDGLARVRAKGWGASGGVALGASAVYTRVIRDLTRADRSLRDYDFVINSFAEPFYMHGGFGYLGLGNGIRLGGIGVQGKRTFEGESRGSDSSMSLIVEVSYGGFLIEKALYRGKMNYILGGHLGGGHIAVVRRAYVDGGLHSFDWDHERGDARAEAGFGSIEVHGGFSYTVLPLLHLGVMLTVPAVISPDGFGATAGEFYSVNPGLQARIIFGTLG